MQKIVTLFDKPAGTTRNGIFGFGRAKNGTIPRSFARPIFCAVFDSRSSFFAPKPHGTARACYTG